MYAENMSNAMKFGPQTMEVTALLAHAAHVPAEQLNQLVVLDTPKESQEAAQRAIHDGFRDVDHLSEHILTLQVLQMAEQFYPTPVINAALALSRKHRILDGMSFTQEDYDMLTTPWDQVVGLPELVA